MARHDRDGNAACQTASGRPSERTARRVATLALHAVQADRGSVQTMEAIDSVHHWQMLAGSGLATSRNASASYRLAVHIQRHFSSSHLS